MRQGRRPSIKYLDRLWSQCVKARDGYKSQCSGSTENLNAHHILGKATYRLRYSLDNGITITGGEHQYIAHGSRTRESKFEALALGRLEVNEQEALQRIKYLTGGVDLFAVEMYLKMMLKKFEKSQRPNVVPPNWNAPLRRRNANHKDRLRTIGRRKAREAMAHKTKE